MFTRITFLALLLCGCSSLPKPDPSTWPSAARPTPMREEDKFWEPTAVERSRAEQLARWYASKHLELSPHSVRKMKTDCTGWHKEGRTELWIQFFDPKLYHPNADGFFMPMDGGFPTYFAVTVDVGIWRVIDHYASPE